MNASAVTQKTMTAAWNAMKSNYPNSTRAINFVKKNLPKNTEYALETIENIVRHGACNEGDYMYYSDCVTYFTKYHKELMAFYAEYAKDLGVSVSSIITGFNGLSEFESDEVVRAYYAKDKTVDGYELIVSTIWHAFVEIICSDIINEIESEQY